MLKCELRPTCGRMIVAAQSISAGQIIFSEEAYSLSPTTENPKKEFCVYCGGRSKKEVKRCAVCHYTYCSDACYNNHSETHVANGECAALEYVNEVKHMVDEEDIDTFRMVCLLLARAVAEGESDNLSRSLGQPSGSDLSVETVGLGEEDIDPIQLFEKSSPLVSNRSTYLHVECLVTNLNGMDKEIRADFEKLFDIYQAGLAKKIINNCLLPTNVSRDTFVSLCSAFLCNGFGIWDSQGRKQATSVYPQSSYFNHSCAPNLGRRHVPFSREMVFFAAKDIAAGEPLCISYVDMKLPAAERIAKLQATYSFRCDCFRCEPSADFITADTVCGDFIPPLCYSCSTRILQHIGDGQYVCPCCNEIQSV